MIEDRVEYRGQVKGIPGDLIRQVPATLKCRSCGQVLANSKKDHKLKRMSVDIVTTIPPELMHDGAVMGLICSACGSKTLLQLS